MWWWLACSTPDPVPAVPEVAPAPEVAAEAAPGQLPVSTAPATHPEVPWRGAWPVVSGVWVPERGRVGARTGLTATRNEQPCAGGLWVDDPGGGVAWFPPGPDVAFEDAVPVPAAAVERATWRAAEALGPATRVQPGGRTDIAPAQEDGVVVRTARKTRIEGAPPVLATIGERDGQVAVLLVDRDGSVTHAGVVFASPGADVVSGALPIRDYDGDGALDWLVYGNAPDGSGYRATLRVTLRPRLALELLALEAREVGVVCP